MSWESIKGDLGAPATQRLQALQQLEGLFKTQGQDAFPIGELLGLAPSLLTDNNSKVAQQALDAINALVLRDQEGVKPFVSNLARAVGERLGDSQQVVRAKALQVLVSLFQLHKPELVWSQLSPLWQHKNWKIKHGLLEVLAEAVKTSGSNVLLGNKDQYNSVLKQVIKMADDPDMTVRDAAANCLAEIHNVAPAAVVATVNASSLRPMQQRELLGRLGAAGCYDESTFDVPAAASNRTATLTSHAIDIGAQLDAPVAPRPEFRRPAAAAPAPAGPPAAASAPVKRGGFKDGGGVSLDGELPPATPIPITSERELRADMEAAVATLAQAPNAEWQDRMAAMQRVEGLLLGGAAEYEAFHESLKGLAQALSQQFKERRSIIARQACHLICVLVRSLGAQFEPHALTLLPTLFGVLVITVQVMAESADAGMRGILWHCQTGRLLQAIADGVCKEKNPKTRQFCANYVKLILEDWDVGVWGRQLEAVEAAIRAAGQDSAADTRQAARGIMALYHAALPDRAAAFLKRLDGGLQDKLSAGLGGPAKAPSARPASSLSRAAMAASKFARQASLPLQSASGEDDIVIMVAGPKQERTRMEHPQHPQRQAPEEPAARPRGSSRVSNAFAALPMGGSSSEVLTSLPPELSAARPQGSVAAGGAPAAVRSGRKSLCLPPGRIPGGSADLTALLGDGAGSGSSQADPGAQARLAALRRRSALPFDLPQRVPAPAPAPTPASVALRTAVPMAPAAHERSRVSSDGTMAAGTSSRPPSGQGFAPPPRPNAAWVERSGTAAATPHAVAPASGVSAAQAAPAAFGPGLVPLPRVTAALVGGPRTWNDKVEALSALALHVRASAPGGSALVDGATASLAAEPERVTAALERVRERLFEALDDPHQKVLSAVLSLVGDVVRAHPRVLEAQLDRLLPLLFNKGADSKELQRAACAEVLAECGRSYRPEVLLPVLSKCLDLVRVPRGRQAVLEFCRAHVLRGPGGQNGAEPAAPVNTTHLKHWLVRLAPLLEDKSADLRRRAVELMEGLAVAPWAREPIAFVAYQHNSADMGPLRRYLLATQGPPSHSTQQLGLTAAAPTSSMTGTVTGSTLFVGGPHAAAAAAAHPHMTVNGVPPATTSEARIPLPSANHVLPTNAPSVSHTQPPGPTHIQPAAVVRSSSMPGTTTAPAPHMAAPMPGGTVSWGGQRPAPVNQPPFSTQQHYQPQTAQHPHHSAQLPTAAAPSLRPPTSALPPQPTHRTSAGGGLPDPYSAPYLSQHLPGAASSPSYSTSPPVRRTPEVPREPAAQQVFLAQLLDAARAALAHGSPVGAAGSSGGGGVMATAALFGGTAAGLAAQTRCMEDLMDAVARCSREVWSRTFPLLMVDVSSWVRHPSKAVRSMCYALLRELLCCQPQLFTDANLESQVGLLLQGCGDASKEAAMTASQALRTLLGTCNAHKAMLLLQLLLPRERDAHRRAQAAVQGQGQAAAEGQAVRGERLVAVMDGARQLAGRLDRSELQALTFSPHPHTGTTLLEGLVSNLNDSETTVRKSAVIALADLWYRLGHGVRDVLQVLALSSYHLLCVYYLKLHGVSAMQPGENPVQHPLVLGGGGAAAATAQQAGGAGNSSGGMGFGMGDLGGSSFGGARP